VDEDLRIYVQDRTVPSFSMNEKDDLFTCLLSVSILRCCLYYFHRLFRDSLIEQVMFF
jgi:hypothetical protein